MADYTPIPYAEIVSGQPNTAIIKDATLAEVPEFDNPIKNKLLDYLICGAQISEACKFVGIRTSTLRTMQAVDPIFRTWCLEKGPQLRLKLANSIIHAGFTRNLYLALEIDYRILLKAAISPELLSDNDEAYLRTIRRMYGPDNLINMIKATTGQSTDIPTGRAGTTITVVINENQVHDQAAQQAAARQLLDDFRRQGNVIEGESRVVDG